MQKTSRRPQPSNEPETVAPTREVHGVDLADAILDEIDAVLEETVTQHAYVQKGGQ